MYRERYTYVHMITHNTCNRDDSWARRARRGLELRVPEPENP